MLKKNLHTISIYVVNQPGVLARVSQVFSRRGFNIDSLVVSSGKDGKYSRMTITAQGDPNNLDQIIKQLSKLIDVVSCNEHSNINTVVKELALIKMQCTAKDRNEILQIVEHFACKTIDFTLESLIIQGSGDTEKLDALINLLSNYNVLEVIRTGKVVMTRGQDVT